MRLAEDPCAALHRVDGAEHRIDGVVRRRTFAQIGKTRFDLLQRLAALVENGVLYRSPSADAHKRYEYHLTEKGLGFYPVALSLWIWEGHWADAADLVAWLVSDQASWVTGQTIASDGGWSSL